MTVTSNEAAENAVLRVCQYTLIQPGMRKRYRELHDNSWPGVLDRIRKSNFRNYTIFLRGDMLVQYYEYVGTDFDADLAAMQADPESQRWWLETGPCQLDPEPHLPGGPWRDFAPMWRLEDFPVGS
ncbi:L-rhamnose mutarotase [Curtobacterium albidum]|uniref:L-rhamnose mutarotase n=1 Tax=Curtobacterium citreum TaxID=2036 RepID=A0A850DUP3_9MICO|nr:L-rhamnose mutarotase [Curtobacterium albidum]NUU27183.1 L-rhamnose mutarotase [Curtobacterium albidum]